MVRKLPSDFDIFSSLMRTKAWCSQWRTNGTPAAPSDCAISFSWCGKIRSSPPPWRSNGWPRYLIAHRRALDVPARTPRTPRALPRRLARLRGLPEREVERVALALVDLDARARHHVVEPALRELAVARELTDGEVDVAVRRVGEAALLELPRSARASRRCARWRAARASGATQPSPMTSSLKGADVALGELARGDPLLLRALDDLVVDVGEVAHEASRR